MRRVPLGKTGLTVSNVCFGTMSFGGDADEAMSARLYARCRQAGIDFFDCANVYSGGKAEEILGRLMKTERDRLVITSKVHGRMGDGPDDAGLSRAAIVKQAEASLQRLQTDRIDVYFCHQVDPATPVEETLRAMDELVKAGKVRFPALSNWAAWQAATACGIADRRKLARPAVLQPMYSLVKRQAESEILPFALAEGLGVIPYSPLAGGLLSGKYADGARPAVGRINDNEMYAKRFAEGWQHETASALARMANQRGVHPATLAVAWVMSHPAVTAPILGARNLEQLEPALAAAELPFTAADRSAISKLSRPPAVANDRTESRPAD